MLTYKLTYGLISLIGCIFKLSCAKGLRTLGVGGPAETFAAQRL